MAQHLQRCIRRVAEVFGCHVRCVKVEVTLNESEAHPEENGLWWTIRVATRPQDKRFRADNVSDGVGRTLGQAERAVVARRPDHEKWSQPKPARVA